VSLLGVRCHGTGPPKRLAPGVRPSLRSGSLVQVSSVGTPPRAIHGPSRLSRHPCREAHCAEPPLGLPMGRVDQKPLRRPTGLFECGIGDRHMFSVGAGLARDAGTSFYLDDQSAAIAGKPAPTGGLVLFEIFAFAVAMRLSRRRECPSFRDSPQWRNQNFSWTIMLDMFSTQRFSCSR